MSSRTFARRAVGRARREAFGRVSRFAWWLEQASFGWRTGRRDAGPLERAPDDRFLRYAYSILFRRDPDPGAWELYTGLLARGEITRETLLDHLRCSEELRFSVPMNDLLLSLHHSRCDFVRTFPRARRILDLGGTHQSDRAGALVSSLHYPYPFEQLVIVDLPFEDRHEIYRFSERADEVQTHLGPVSYRYHSMTDLSAFDDGSFDLVYSGQTIEHVTPDEADQVLAEVHRVLRPGGWLCLDTPNGPVCRLQQPDFINPDHEVEYSVEELEAKLVGAGLEVVEMKGLNYLGRPVADGVFDKLQVAHNTGIYGEAADCYLLAAVCRRP